MFCELIAGIICCAGGNNSTRKTDLFVRRSWSLYHPRVLELGQEVIAMNKVVTFSSVVALGVALAGCTGMVAGTGSGNGGPGNPGTPGGGAGGASAQMPGGGTTANPNGGAAGVLTIGAPGASLMHRLNTAEYNATVADVLGTKLQPADANWRGGEIDGFDNIASVLGVDDDQYGLYVDAAQALAEDVFASPTLQAKVLTCTTADDMTCVKNIITQTGLRVFRRPVVDAEFTAYTKVYTTARANGQDHAGSVKHVLWSMLASAQFLYRMEFDNGVATKHPITGYELASRLSYFLWSSAPDDTMLAAADTLNTDAAIASTVDRMLADMKSSRFVTNFAGQWLGARNVVAHPVDKTLYPKWTPDVANAASAEMYAYFDEFLRKNLQWTDFLKMDVNFVNQPLAAFYGMPAVTGTATTRTVFTGDKRQGFLGLVGFLANSSVAARSSPTLRGKWLLVNLMCAPPPPPPANVPKLEATNAHPESTNVRTVLEAHRAAPNCAVCHSLMDPFGLALEQYDGVGQFRTSYPDMSVIDPATSLPVSSSFPNGIMFSGLDGAETAVGTDPRFKACIAQKLYTYGLGRSLSPDDVNNAAVISKTWQDGGDLSISKLLHTLTLAEAFRNRTPSM
jgi:hypothetical protein